MGRKWGERRREGMDRYIVREKGKDVDKEVRRRRDE